MQAVGSGTLALFLVTSAWVPELIAILASQPEDNRICKPGRPQGRIQDLRNGGPNQQWRRQELKFLFLAGGGGCSPSLPFLSPSSFPFPPVPSHAYSETKRLPQIYKMRHTQNITWVKKGVRTHATSPLDPPLGRHRIRGQVRGWLPSLNASPPFGRYQIILLGDRHADVNNLSRVVTRRPGVEPATVKQWLQLWFDFDSTVVRLQFDCDSNARRLFDDSIRTVDACERRLLHCESAAYINCLLANKLTN